MKGDTIMSDLKKYINKQMQDDEFCREYEKTRQAFAFQREMIRARTEKQMTQKQLADLILAVLKMEVSYQMCRL